jgi:hypothetical protein
MNYRGARSLRLAGGNSVVGGHLNGTGDSSSFGREWAVIGRIQARFTVEVVEAIG